MRTYTSPLGGWAGEYALLAGLALVVACASSAAAQQRKYLVELGAAGAYQSFDRETVLGGAPGGLARLGVWLPLNFSLEVEGGVASPNTKDDDQSVSVKTLSVAALATAVMVAACKKPDPTDVDSGPVTADSTAAAAAAQRR